MQKLRLFVALVGTAALFLMTGSPADASSTFTMSCTPGTAGSNSDCTSWKDYGSTTKPASTKTVLPSGWVIAHYNAATSPITPVPNAGDVVGSVDGYGDLLSDGCGNPTHSTYTVTWVAPDGTGPTGTVAQMRARATVFGINIDVKIYVVLTSGIYSIEVPVMPSSFYCSGQPQQQTNTTYGVVSGSSPARKVSRLPTTAGTYTVNNSWVGSNGTTYTDSTTVVVS